MSSPQLDIIQVNFDTYSLYTRPLEQYWELHGNRPPLFSTTSGNSRGYIATWRIEDGRLYLIKFWGETLFAPGYKVYDIFDIFPGHPNRVFAEWYTGELTIGKGEMLDDLPIRQYQVTADVRDGIIIDLDMQD